MSALSHRSTLIAAGLATFLGGAAVYPEVMKARDGTAEVDSKMRQCFNASVLGNAAGHEFLAVLERNGSPVAETIAQAGRQVTACMTAARHRAP